MAYAAPCRSAYSQLAPYSGLVWCMEKVLGEITPRLFQHHLCKYNLSLLFLLCTFRLLVPRYVRVICSEGVTCFTTCDSRGSEDEHALTTSHVETVTGRVL